MLNRPSRPRDRWIRAAVVVIALGGLALVARNVDWPAAWRALQRMGARAPLIAVPYAIILAIDSFGWRNTFEHPQGISVFALWRIRIATEAVSNSLPAGPAIGETLKAMILQRRLGMRLTDAAANVVITKFAIAIAQALFTVAALVLAAPTLQSNSHKLLGRDGLEWIAFGVAFGFLAIVTLGLWAVARGKLFGRVLQRLVTFREGRLRHRLERFGPLVERADHALAVIERVPWRRTVLAIGQFFIGFIVMGLENFVILALLSSGVTIPQAISMEALLALVRIGFFFLPSALGAQEAGYYLALRAFGVADAEILAAAFMVAKRAKELLWIGTGYALLSSLHVHVSDARKVEPIAP
jgi:uncharacterized membrane protein YbhN (UPF0104 family)